MFSRARIALTLALLLISISGIHALAGGWAVITLDKLPGEVPVGQPLTISFMVRQHGRTPMAGLDPIVAAQTPTNSVTVHAKPQGEVGHYIATFTFPEAGTWNWKIQAFTMEQQMPPLMVVKASTPVNPSAPPHLLWVGILGLGIGLAGAVIALRQKKRWAMGLAISGLAIGLAAFVAPMAPSAGTAARAEAQPVANIPQAGLGQQLFVAKGCVTCHVNNNLPDMSQYESLRIGPNLTDVKAKSLFLEAWLADPSALKPDTQMPNLNLSEDEINALVAFLTSK